ncbi:MAG: glycosyltransferase [Bacteroidetes bacterium]|nr:glycosyltransferase [Bacteroidota bacterium]
MLQPLVSIILSSYNQPEFLEKAFYSLINQTYKNIEIIIVDDCSGDERNKILIEQWKQLYPGKVNAFYQTKNVGIPANKNTGFRLAKGGYITYLDGDDTYYENKIAKEVETFQQHPDVDVVYSNFDIKNIKGDIISVWSSTPRPEGFIFEDILLNNFPDCHTHRYEMFRKRVLYELNFYDENLNMYEDLDLMIRYSLKFKVAYNNYIGSSYFKNPDSIIGKSNGLNLIEQQEKIYSKYVEEIKAHGFENKFKKRLAKLNLDKHFFANRINYSVLMKAFIKQPNQAIKILKIINYLNKKQQSH